jgi:hypothetical protein
MTPVPGGAALPIEEASAVSAEAIALRGSLSQPKKAQPPEVEGSFLDPFEPRVPQDDLVACHDPPPKEWPAATSFQVPDMELPENVPE